jgi:hypothetical protein
MRVSPGAESLVLPHCGIANYQLGEGDLWMEAKNIFAIDKGRWMH